MISKSCPMCTNAIGFFNANALCYDHKLEMFESTGETYEKRVQPEAVPKKRSKKAKLPSSNAKRSYQSSSDCKADRLEEPEGEVGC